MPSTLARRELASAQQRRVVYAGPGRRIAFLVLYEDERTRLDHWVSPLLRRLETIWAHRLHLSAIELHEEEHSETAVVAPCAVPDGSLFG